MTTLHLSRFSQMPLVEAVMTPLPHIVEPQSLEPMTVTCDPSNGRGRFNRVGLGPAELSWGQPGPTRQERLKCQTKPSEDGDYSGG